MESIVSPATKGAIVSFSPTRDGVEPYALGANPSLMGILGAVPHKTKVVSMIRPGAKSSGSGTSRASSPEAEELKLAMEVGGIVGLSYEADW